MKCVAVLVTVLTAWGGFAAALTDPIDWTAAKPICKGVSLVQRTYSAPRLMCVAALRVDLRTPGLQFVGTPRAANWGEPIPGFTNGPCRVRTVRQYTVDFMRTERAKGRNMAAAFNTAFWVPSISPLVPFADPLGLNISDGVVVSGKGAATSGAFFVAWKSGRCEIVSSLTTNRLHDIQVAHAGSPIFLRGGRPCVTESSVHPRTACGLSSDGRYLYILAVDGRQPKRSKGASMADLARLMLSAGASTAMNFDGGGSTSLVYWDGQKPVMVNRHAYGYRRATAMNIGICIP